MAAEVQQLRADLDVQNKRVESHSYKLIDIGIDQDQTIDAVNRLSRAAKDAEAAPTAAAKTRLDQLAIELDKRGKQGQKGVTYAEAGKILGISKSMVCRLRDQIGADSRFNVSWHPVKKNKKIISLKKLR